MKKVSIKFQHTLSLQQMHELATIFLSYIDNYEKTPEDFKKFCKDQLKSFGTENFGMHSENGYCDYSDKQINEASHFLCENFQAKGVIHIYKYGKEPITIYLNVFTYDVLKGE